jgi:hypothetical protein
VAQVTQHLLSPEFEPQSHQKKKKFFCWALVAHACNPSYSGGRDQEDHSQPPQISLRDPISKIPNSKMGWCAAQGVGLEFKLQYGKKKKKVKMFRDWLNHLATVGRCARLL